MPGSNGPLRQKHSAAGGAAYRYVLLAVLAAALVAGVVFTAAACAKRAVLTGLDALTPPDRRVLLRAKLERDRWPYPDIHGQPVEFLLDGRRLGVAPSDHDGVASLLYQPGKPGDFLITVRLAPEATCHAPPDKLLLAVWNTDTRILVTDVDHTIADVRALEFLRVKDEDIPALPGAAAALREIAAQYRIVYLTGRDEAFARRTRAWLDMNSLPSGPVFYWDFLGSPLAHGRFKAQTIAGLKKTYGNIEAGVGDLASDARAYLENGLRTFILADKARRDLPRAAIPVPSWDAVRLLLLESGPTGGNADTPSGEQSPAKHL